MEKRKWVGFKALMVVFFCLFCFQGCEKDDQKMKDFYFVDIRPHSSDWDYLAFSNDGGSFLIKEKNGKPELIYYKAGKDIDGYPIFMDEQGFPRKAVIQGHIFLFGKAGDYQLDIAMIRPNGEIVITRGIEVEYNLNELSGLILKDDNSWNNILKWTGRAASVVGCGLSIKAAIVSGGIAIPLAVVGCGSFAVSTAADALDMPLLEASSEGVGLGITAIGCGLGDWGGCIAGTTAFASYGVGIATNTLNENESSVQIAMGVLQGGHGDIQVTLTWNSVCDLDLWVTDPWGETIKWNNRTSASGGYLDHDNTYGYGPENIFWPAAQAPSGTYQVRVNYFSGSGTSTYSVLIIVGDQVLNNGQPFTGQISPSQTIHVISFTYSGKSEPEKVLEIYELDKINPESFEKKF